MTEFAKAMSAIQISESVRENFTENGFDSAAFDSDVAATPLQITNRRHRQPPLQRSGGVGNHPQSATASSVTAAKDQWRRRRPQLKGAASLGNWR